MRFLSHARRRRTVRLVLLGVLLFGLFLGALFLAQYVEHNAAAQALVSQFGYAGIVFLALVAGLNVILPIPAASFTPVFLAADLSMPLIILSLVVGTIIADFIGYLIGRFGHTFVSTHYPKTQQKLRTIREQHRRWLLPFVGFYAAFVPFPNEAMLIPLAVSGVRFSALLIPLLIGNAINQTILAYGINNFFTAFF